MGRGLCSEKRKPLAVRSCHFVFLRPAVSSALRLADDLPASLFLPWLVPQCAIPPTLCAVFQIYGASRRGRRWGCAACAGIAASSVQPKRAPAVLVIAFRGEPATRFRLQHVEVRWKLTNWHEGFSLLSSSRRFFKCHVRCILHESISVIIPVLVSSFLGTHSSSVCSLTSRHLSWPSPVHVCVEQGRHGRWCSHRERQSGWATTSPGDARTC